jgi:hypothetical protein
MSSEWIGALVSAGALLYAVFLHLRNRGDGRRRAALVAIDAQRLPASDDVIVTVHNGAASPIWNCAVSVSSIKGEIYRDVWGAVMPGLREHRVTEVPKGPVTNSVVEFTDGDEHRWRRDARGILSDLGRVIYRRHFFSCSGG